MPEPHPHLEVETRLHFDDEAEAYRVLPFLRDCLDRELIWYTHLHGPKLYSRGEQLRIAGGHAPGGGDHHSLGWKGPDRGGFANIRAEIDEEITRGITRSAILAMLGGGPDAESPAAAAAELERLGHPRFATFAGRSLLGLYEPLGLQLKLMACRELRWPMLLEIEKTARDEAGAAEAEKELRLFLLERGLIGRVVRQEPPDLLSF